MQINQFFLGFRRGNKKNTVVTFKYSLINEDGTLVGETETQETAILQGHRNVVQGVEKGLAGKKAGDQFVVQVPPEEGYGPRREDLSLIHISEPTRPY